MNWTLLSLLNWTTDYFTKQKISTPRLDAEVLLAFLLKIDRLQLYLKFERPVNAQELSAFKALIKRRVKGEPVSYIRGIKEFWSLNFHVGPGVMVPRPDTEILVEKVAGGREQGAGNSPLNILDIGTGSGNIAIALAKEFSHSKISAVDISADALKYARDNARLNDVASQIDFVEEDFFSCSLLPAPFHLIVSNPPYIPSEIIETLDPGIREYEPRLAFDGGADGLDFYRRMIQSAFSLLKPGGVLAVEIGEDQGSSVKEIFNQAGLKEIEVVNDYADLPRVVIGRRK